MNQSGNNRRCSPVVLCVAVLLLMLLLVIDTNAAAALDVPAGAPAPVSARGAVLWDPADQRVLWGNNEEVPLPMASTTKMMTALIAVEAGTLAEDVVVSSRAAQVGRTPGGASLGLKAGQRIPMDELLAGLMIRSGNDAAIAVAEHVAGSEREFVALMNDKVSEWELDETVFLNASGLTDDPRHHASPLDLARLGERVLANPQLAEWSGARTWPTETFGTIQNRNELLTTYAGATGVKTGFTTLAGRCLVASAQRGDRTLISVVLGSENHFVDSARILDHGFENFERIELPAGTPVGTWRTSSGTTAVVTTAAIARTVPSGGAVATMHQPPLDQSEFRAGAMLGDLKLAVGDEVVATTALSADSAIVASAGRSGVATSLQDGLRALARLATPPQTLPDAFDQDHIEQAGSGT